MKKKKKTAPPAAEEDEGLPDGTSAAPESEEPASTVAAQAETRPTIAPENADTATMAAQADIHPTIAPENADTATMAAQHTGLPSQGDRA